MRIRLSAIVLVASLCVSGVAAQKPDVPTPDGQSQASTSDILPPNFRGRISYSGTHEGSVTRAGPPLRSLRTRDILRSVTGGTTREYGGAFNLELTFQGNAVTGRFSGSGGIGSGTLSGTRSGSRCRLFNDLDGTVTEAECTRTRFIGEAHGQRGGASARTRIEAEATHFVDAAVEERERHFADASAAEREQRVPAAGDRSTRQQAAGSAAARQPAALQHSGMARCWALGFAAPTSQADLDRIPTIQLLNRGQVMAANRDWFCSSLYYGAAALRNDVQGMAAYSYSFSSEAPDQTPDRGLQVFWCQRAYRGARASGRSYELDAVNYFCPIETIAALMTPAERRANRVSEERAERISAEYQREVEARGMAMWRSLWEPSPSSNRGTCRSGYGTGTPGTEQPC
jgi:hypothetical protein